MPNLTGQSIGRYHIIEQLGEGGMATVYKAYDTRLERNVALKILRTDQFIPAQLQMVLQRFEREAKSLAKLKHPNIVNILDFGEHEGMPYLVMEYLPGGTLKQKLGQKVPWQDAIQTLIPVARGLSYAHQHGVIHRDVKPANVLLDQNDDPILTDFGIAKLLEGTEGHTLTGSGVGIGTPEYMAPEQGIGASTIDARADIYSLGIVLYEMVTGRKPYIADTPMAVVLKQMTDPLPRPTDFVPDLPEGVEHILFKALSKQPEDRYENMNAFIAAMESVAETQRVEVQTPAKRVKKRVAPFDKFLLRRIMTVIGVLASIMTFVFGIPWANRQFSAMPTAATKVFEATPTTITMVSLTSPLELSPSQTLIKTSYPSPTITSIPAWVTNILAYIAGQPSNFEDNFSTQKAGWGNNSEGMAVFSMIENNRLRVEDGIEPGHEGPFLQDFKVPGVFFPTTGLFDASDFALQFVFEFGGMKSVALQFRSAMTMNTGYNITFEPSGHWELNSSSNIAPLAEGYQEMNDGYNKVQVIVNGNNLAISLNNKYLFTADNILPVRTANRIIVTGYRNGADCYFDDFKFWNLDGVEFSTSSTSPMLIKTPAPAWVTNFTEPILSAIKDREPYFQDDFGPDTEGWVSGYPNLPISIEEGVLRLKQGGSVNNIFLRNNPNFVLQVDISRPASCCTHVELSGDNSIYLGDSGWGICRPAWTDCSGNTRSFPSIIQVTIIVKGSQAGFYLMGIPVFYFEDSKLTDTGRFGNVTFKCDKSCEFDNIKFWNIKNITIP